MPSYQGHLSFSGMAASHMPSQTREALEQGELHGHSGIIMDTVHDPKQ